MSIKATSAKITTSHRTLTETADEVIRAIDSMNSVTKISLGAIRHVPGGRRDIKFKPITGGINASIRGNGAVQDVYIYTKEADSVKKELQKMF